MAFELIRRDIALPKRRSLEVLATLESETARCIDI